MLISLKIRNINTSKYSLDEFVFTAVYIPGLDWENSKVYMYIKYEFYLVENLKANMLINKDILHTKCFLIKIVIMFAYILECEVNIKITAGSHSQSLRCNIPVNTITFVSPKFKVFIFYWQIFLPILRDFLSYLYS